MESSIMLKRWRICYSLGSSPRRGLQSSLKASRGHIYRHSSATATPRSKPRDISYVPESLDPRWLSELKQRVGKCIHFGLPAEQMNAAGSILSELARDWRELVAGSEGYLTDSGRRGLFRFDEKVLPFLHGC